MTKVKLITRTAVLLALTIALQGLRLGQLATGSLVNSMLYISTCIIGWPSGVFIGCVTPWIALLFGILKPALAPAVLFIMISNAVLVLTFSIIKDRSYIIAVIVASCAKFLTLYISTEFLIKLKPVVVTALQFPQLITALIGGIIAFIVVSILKSIVIIKH